MPASGHSFRCQLGLRRVNGEHGDHLAQVESVVDPVSEGAGVGLGALSVFQRLEGARHPGHTDASGVGDCGKAPGAVADNDGLGQQAGLGPPGNRLRREAADPVELTAVVHRDGGDGGSLVLRAPPGLAPRAFPTEVGVIQLHGTAEQPSGFLVRHGAVDLVVQQPGGGVAQAQVALERQGRNPGLGLAVLRCRSGSETQE